MRWITPDWAARASDVSSLLPRALTVVCVARSYAGPPIREGGSNSGRIARYAWGEDYHKTMGDRLTTFSQQLQGLGADTRAFVDTAPTMDKALAARAGIGWQGKNTNILSRELGSFFVLGGVVSDLELQVDAPMPDGCGKCHACVRACPTGALKGDYTIDARLCISYLTIEHRGPIPRSLRPLVGDWVFGCDICQDVCPPVTNLQDAQFPFLKDVRIRSVRQALSTRFRGGPEVE